MTHEPLTPEEEAQLRKWLGSAPATPPNLTLHGLLATLDAVRRERDEARRGLSEWSLRAGRQKVAAEALHSRVEELESALRVIAGAEGHAAWIAIGGRTSGIALTTEHHRLWPAYARHALDTTDTQGGSHG